MADGALRVIKTGYDAPRKLHLPEGITRVYTVYVDGVRAVGAASGSALPPVTSADVDVLLESVPEGFRDSCEDTAVSMFEPGAIVAVSCSLGHPDADVVEYVQFDSTESLEAAYQQRVASYASDVTGTTCSEGSSELAYDIAGQEAGRLFCGPQTVGIRLDWTDTRLNILSSAIDYDAGSEGYPGLFQIWLLAGPELPSGEIQATAQSARVAQPGPRRCRNTGRRAIVPRSHGAVEARLRARLAGLR